MEQLTLSLFVLVLVASTAMIAVALVWRERFFHYPALAAMLVAGYYLPQARALLDDSTIDQSAFALTLFIILVTLIAIEAGWQAAVSHRRNISSRDHVTNAKVIDVVFIGILLLAIVGIDANYKLRDLPEYLLRQTQWSGPPTIYAFFTRLNYMVFGISLAAFFRSRRIGFLLLVAATTASFVDIIVFGGRREPLAFVFLAVVLSLFFAYRWLPPRIVLLSATVVGVLFVNSTGAYRAATGTANFLFEPLNWERFLDDLGRIRWVENVVNKAPPEVYDLRNAVELIGGTRVPQDLGFGTAYWNRLVFGFVPAQLLGREFKEGLMLERGDLRKSIEYYTPRAGSVWSGFADSYREFALFGPLVFAMISWFLGWVYVRALAGDILAQGTYAWLVTKGLIAISHQSSNFLYSLVYAAVFLGPIVFVSKTLMRNRERMCLRRVPKRRGICSRKVHRIKEGARGGYDWRAARRKAMRGDGAPRLA